jgi:hypothetical protein
MAAGDLGDVVYVMIVWVALMISPPAVQVRRGSINNILTVVC